MQRWFRLSLMTLALGVLLIGSASAQTRKPVYVSGRIAPNEVRVFAKDSIYVIHKDYTVTGTLLIEPGTTITFYPHGRLIDSVGGRIIADGYAKATYNSSIDAMSPINGVDYLFNFADPKYLLLDAVLNKTTLQEPTIDPKKNDYIFSVNLDTTFKAMGLSNYEVNKDYTGQPKLTKIPFEKAMAFVFSRMAKYDGTNGLNTSYLRRENGTSIDVKPAAIQFIGQPVDNFSPEWGHIVVLPGARAAFFRNCSFENFKKDTTVASSPYYTGNYNPAQLGDLNKEMIKLVNGSGGAITTFSVRTWMVDCQFKRNSARYRGGALQVLQAPLGTGVYPTVDVATLPTYPIDKNPALVDQFTNDASAINSSVPMIDNLDDSLSIPAVDNLSDASRQAVDDARIAMYLGRFRRLDFSFNNVVLANVIRKTLPGGVEIIQDDYDNPANFPYGDTLQRNGAFGGAVYISGWNNPNSNGTSWTPRNIEVGFGINDMMKINGVMTKIEPAGDFVKFTSNYTLNLQNNKLSATQSNGSFGGAIYVKDYTSLIVAGQFNNNETKVYNNAKTLERTKPDFSQGGAIYVASSFNRFQVRGGTDRGTVVNTGSIFDKKVDGTVNLTSKVPNPTLFKANKSGMGGAIFLSANSPVSSFDPRVYIGGSDNSLSTRNFGYNVKFLENIAEIHGGAIYSNRNMFLYGAGGTPTTVTIGYDELYKLEFTNNQAGFSGGAIDISLTDNIVDAKSIVRVVRANFNTNKSWRN